jgi:hypothetical protein
MDSTEMMVVLLLLLVGKRLKVGRIGLRRSVPVLLAQRLLWRTG